MTEPLQLFPVIRAVAIFLGLLAFVFGIGLAFAARKFFVKTDPLVDSVKDVLAHAHCGACGFAGCEQYAEAVIDDPAVAPNLCTPGGKQCTESIARLTGKIPMKKEPRCALVMCQGGSLSARKKSLYRGVKDCRAAVLAGGGDKTCAYGCLGYGTCMRACLFGAITMDGNDLPVVDMRKCTACGKCVAACPKKVVEIVPASAGVFVECHSKDKGAVTRTCCCIGCIGCGKCVKVCPVAAITLESNLARIDPAVCTACGTCVGVCPVKAIVKTV